MRIRTVNVRADASPNSNNKSSKIQIFRKKVEGQRNSELKENINKLIGIASGDTRFIKDTFDEISLIHKDIVDAIKNKTDPKTEKRDNVNTDNIDETNIFLKDK